MVLNRGQTHLHSDASLRQALLMPVHYLQCVCLGGSVPWLMLRAFSQRLHRQPRGCTLAAGCAACAGWNCTSLKAWANLEGHGSWNSVPGSEIVLRFSLSHGLSSMGFCSQWNSKENPEYRLTSCFLVFTLPLPKYLILSYIHLPLATHSRSNASVFTNRNTMQGFPSVFGGIGF